MPFLIGVWDCSQWWIITPAGTIYLNAPFGTDNFRLLLDHENCSGGPAPLRNGADPMPQADGFIIRTPFLPGFHLSFALEMWAGDDPAVLSDRRVMWEDLTFLLNSMLNVDGQVWWEGVGGNYMLTGCRLWTWPLATDNGIVTQVTFEVVSADPVPQAAIGPPPITTLFASHLVAPTPIPPFSTRQGTRTV